MAVRAISSTLVYQPNHPPKPIELAARHALVPFRQGELDGLCGLYAAIAALRLALADEAPLSKAACKALFADGIDFLQRKKGLRDAVTDGMGPRRRFALARHLARQISAASCPVTVERPDFSHWSSIDDVFVWIDESLRQGHPVLAALLGGLDHYTVIAGSTPTTLRVFDSAGMQFIRKANCGLRAGFHQIPPNSLIRVVVRTPT